MQSGLSNYPHILQRLFHSLSFVCFLPPISFIFFLTYCPFVLPCLHLPSVYLTSFPSHLFFFVLVAMVKSWLPCVLRCVFRTTLLVKIQSNASAEQTLFGGNGEMNNSAISIPDITTNPHKETKLFLYLRRASAVWACDLLLCVIRWKAWNCVKVCQLFEIQLLGS